MRWLLWLLLLPTLAVPDRPAPPMAPKDELPLLDGTWTVVSYEFDGGRLTDAEIAVYPQLIMKAGTFRWSNSESAGVMKIDPSKSPKSVDYSHDQFMKGAIYLGIYQLDGDIFRDCIAPPGKERPQDFTVPPGSGRMMFVYRRVKN